MNPDRVMRIEVLFHAALNLAPDQRAAYLAKVCAGDAELERDVLRYLMQDQRAGEEDFLGLPPLSAATTPPQRRADETVPVREISVPSGARYRLVRPHAKGGLGEVFIAEDQELHRQVALKEIRESLANERTSRGRFLLEAEVTGGLEHPGIVPVYGMGSYVDGRPFYVMRSSKATRSKKPSIAFTPRRLPPVKNDWNSGNS